MGLTVIVKVINEPLQVTPRFVYFGVTVTVAIIGVVPALMAGNAGIFPVPLDAKPIDGVLLVHV